jgi:tetrapyrrole methylase family protein/MazG family protein/ATP diphosphatase
MRRLRGPRGCPWDREQTLDTLKAYVLEEAYEVVDAIDRRDVDGLCEELGDLVFEAVFLAQLCSESGQFTLADAIESANEKLVRRHPHVFGTPDPSGTRRRIRSASDVRQQWDDIKATERADAGRPRGPLEDIPVALPALQRADQLSRRAARTGFDWPSARDVLAKLTEEAHEVEAAVRAGTPAAIRDEIGDLLFVIVNLARKLDIDPEGALRDANTKFARRFEGMRVELRALGLDPDRASLEELERAWNRVKAGERLPAGQRRAPVARGRATTGR